MVINLPPQLESVLANQAKERGLTPEAYALDLIEKNLLSRSQPVPMDDWEKRLFSLGKDCGVSVPDAALSSEGLYE